jgi:hypothetical protein
VRYVHAKRPEGLFQVFECLITTFGTMPGYLLVLFIFVFLRVFDPANEPIHRRTDEECDQDENEKRFLPSNRKHGLTGKHAQQKYRHTRRYFFIHRLLQHRHFDAMTFRCSDGDLITRIRMSDYAHAWICCKDSLQPPSCFRSPIRHDNLSRVL